MKTMLAWLVALLAAPGVSAVEIWHRVTGIEWSVTDPTPDDGIPAFVVDPASPWTLEEFTDIDRLQWSASLWKDREVVTGAPTTVSLHGWLAEGATLRWTLHTRTTSLVYNDPAGGDDLGQNWWGACTLVNAWPTTGINCPDFRDTFINLRYDGRFEMRHLDRSYTFENFDSGPPVGGPMSVGIHLYVAFSNMSSVAMPVPEPATGVLLLGGLLAIAGVRARRRTPR